MPRLRVSPDFQRRCHDRVLQVFKELGLPRPVFRDMSGERPSLTAGFEHRGKTHSIEIYSDDVVMIEGESLYECYLRSEFRSEESWIEGFASRLSRYLSGGDWAGPDEEGWPEKAAEGLKRLLHR
ncbi:MAG: hypothetical protein L0312_32945 [Acidobacteria bacterium]|nr:hypothetical protein [Acidobacteriota bacterium]